MAALCLLLGFGLSGPGLRAQPASEPAVTGLNADEEALLRAVNDYRAARGLARWRVDARLTGIAREHSRRMAADGRLTHEGFRQRAAAAGRASCVESLVAGASVSEQAVSMWRRSPEHHHNLLEPDATWAGVGVVGGFGTLLACASPAPALAPQWMPPASVRSDR